MHSDENGPAAAYAQANGIAVKRDEAGQGSGNDPDAGKDSQKDGAGKDQQKTDGGKTGSTVDSRKNAKAANTMKVKAKTVQVKYAKVRKKAQTFKRAKAIAVSRANGKVTYQLVKVTKAKFKKYFKVNAKTGKLTVKKGLKKGTYKVRVKVRAAGDGKHKPANKTVTVKVIVK